MLPPYLCMEDFSNFLIFFLKVDFSKSRTYHKAQYLMLLRVCSTLFGNMIQVWTYSRECFFFLSSHGIQILLYSLFLSDLPPSLSVTISDQSVNLVFWNFPEFKLFATGLYDSSGDDHDDQFKVLWILEDRLPCLILWY